MKLLKQAWEKLLKWIDGNEIPESKIAPQQFSQLCESAFEAWD